MMDSDFRYRPPVMHRSDAAAQPDRESELVQNDIGKPALKVCICIIFLLFIGISRRSSIDSHVASGLGPEAVSLAVLNYGDNPVKARDFVKGYSIRHEMGFSSKKNCGRGTGYVH
ncbi:unnamed protein product [Musa acuminata subsp. malaccensis]|uniref:(wild Malaysian banana) hypothetical protein n=1 Tax=Musa acuminata subsp. malaccensis TaxID=214687 RepID=A0A804IY86_MUSAM|nr:unnamed protein product [Musa acuminata subsp. malaccensis]